MSTWGEHFDLREFARKIDNVCEIVAELSAKVAQLEEQQRAAVVEATPPIGAWLPRNHRRFGA